MSDYEMIVDVLHKSTESENKKQLKRYKALEVATVAAVSALMVKHTDDKGKIVLSAVLIMALHKVIENQFKNTVNDESKKLEDYLLSSYKTAYEKTAVKLGIHTDWNIINREFIRQAINTPIDGKRFSDRIWNNTNEIANRIYRDVIDCVKTGKRPDEIARKISKDFGVSAYEAKRLTNTELARTVNNAQMQCYKDGGIQKVIYTATLETNTCDTCADYDGKEFDISDAPNIPVHPCCRCCYVPVVEGWTPTKRADNITHKEIDYIDYRGWQSLQ